MVLLKTHLIVACGALLLVGCSTPIPFGFGGKQRELFAGYVGYDSEGKNIRRVVPGVDVRLGRGWDGVSLGWSDLRLLSATPGAFAPPVTGTGQAVSWRWPLAFEWRGQGGKTYHAIGVRLLDRDRQLPTALFIHRVQFGVDVYVAPCANGVSAGYCSCSVLAADPAVDGVWRIEYSSRAPLWGRLIQDKEAPDARP